MNLNEFDLLPDAALRHGCSIRLLKKRLRFNMLGQPELGIPGARKFGRSWGIPRDWKYTPRKSGNPNWRSKRNEKARR